MHGAQHFILARNNSAVAPTCTAAPPCAGVSSPVLIVLRMCFIAVPYNGSENNPQKCSTIPNSVGCSQGCGSMLRAGQTTVSIGSSLSLLAVATTRDSPNKCGQTRCHSTAVLFPNSRVIYSQLVAGIPTWLAYFQPRGYPKSVRDTSCSVQPCRISLPLSASSVLSGAAIDSVTYTHRQPTHTTMQV